MNCPKENNVCDKSDSKYRSDELRKENRKLNRQIEELQDTEIVLYHHTIPPDKLD